MVEQFEGSGSLEELAGETGEGRGRETQARKLKNAEELFEVGDLAVGLLIVSVESIQYS